MPGKQIIKPAARAKKQGMVQYLPKKDIFSTPGNFG